MEWRLAALCRLAGVIWVVGREIGNFVPWVNRVQESALFMNVNVGGLKTYLFHVRKTMKVVSRP